ncbi:FAD-linked sulfhydryl oxidase ALR [Venturia canescens]|uniref:FAD-linked sulfhydryl oxidase ALR n=1 Tax=Venturia canescens TaxID=32260 RepID=UPI001C9C247D|nr:FAD-linked sulfhydryl oxidase ALR [Venturia canescens]
MVQEKPCRTCTDFKTWAAIQKKTYDSEKNEGEKQDDKVEVQPTSLGNVRTDCPLDKDELGSKTWAFLHTMAAYYPEKPSIQQRTDMKTFFQVFSKFYPCNTCAKDLQEQLKKTPPLTDSQDQLSQWLCRMHNEVNKKLGKRSFDCSLVNQRWKDGWLDGSCD